MIIEPDHNSDERFDFCFSEHEGHDKVVDVLVFEQLTIN